MIDRLARYNVVWDSPSKDSSGSMPLGNGDIAVNVWVEEGSGDVLLLIAKSDAWDGNSINLKLGRVRVRFSSNTFREAKDFRQTLDLKTATITITAGDLALRIWVDASYPVVRIETESDAPIEIRAELEMWRTEPRTIKTQTGDIFRDLSGNDPYPTIIWPDHILLSADDRIVWCHHNEKREHDGFEINMKLQGLGEFLNQMPHPLLGRTFGAAIDGADFTRASAVSLASSRPQQNHQLNIHVFTSHPSTIEQWRVDLDKIIEATRSTDLRSARRKHEEWWQQFWNRSWIFIDSPDAFHVTQGYILQRFMNACAGRAGPIKFNGSLFTVGKPDDPDFRRWGGPGFWFQNQRLIYWPMLAAGDFDLMLPWLRMYREQLPLQKHRTQTYFHHGGAHYPETIMFWGAEVSAHYGWTPFEQRARPEAECSYLTYYWSGEIELALIMLEYFEHTRDEEFAREFLFPIADAVIEFFDRHYPRDADGKIRFEPAQSLETWHDATNPLPEIAGFRYLLQRLLALTPSPGTPGEGGGEGSVSEQRASRPQKNPHPDPLPEYRARERKRWQRMLGEIPQIPVGERDGIRLILPAERVDQKKNTENPELYCIFPYRLFGIGKPDHQLARDTFAARLHQSHDCWSQDDIQMALLGLTRQAKDWITKRASPASHSDSRFPGFWNAFHDWIPDMDHGGVLQMALQLMLLQCEGREIRLLPAWPREWDVDLKLHAPFQTIVEAKVRGGQIVELRVTPGSRADDVIYPT